MKLMEMGKMWLKIMSQSFPLAKQKLISTPTPPPSPTGNIKVNPSFPFLP